MTAHCLAQDLHEDPFDPMSVLRDEFRERFAFCLVIEILNGHYYHVMHCSDESNKPYRRGTGFFAAADCSPFEQQMSTFLLPYGFSHNDAEYGSLLDWMNTWNDRYMSLLTIAGLAHRLQQLTMPMPSPGAINFLTPRSVGFLPRPFLSALREPDRWTKWLDTHLDEITDPATIDGSEWFGYYSYHLGFYRLDPPMTDIRFRVVGIDGTTTKVEATGVDNVGAFTLSGTIERLTGALFFRKDYVNRHVWRWKGTMTPFGMCGCWHPALRTRVSGMFWIWRKEWTRDAANPVPS